jgi:hypothetical protein
MGGMGATLLFASIAGCGSDSEPSTIESFTRQGSMIELTYLDNACSILERRVSVVESADTVEASVALVRTDALCTTEGVLVSVQVPLESPIRGRQVVDANGDVVIPEQP